MPRRMAGTGKGPKNKIKWVLSEAWQPHSAFLIQFLLPSGQELTNHSLLPVFVSPVLLGHSCAHVLSLAAFALKLQDCGVAPRPHPWPAKPRLRTLWPFTKKKLANPHN